MRPAVHQDTAPRGGREGYHHQGPALPIPFRSPAQAQVRDDDLDQLVRIERLERLVSQYESLQTNLLQQMLVLRAERDEARQGLDTVLEHLQVVQSVVIAQAAQATVASTVLKSERQCEAKLHCPTCPGLFVPIGYERVCMPCNRANRARIANEANKRRRQNKQQRLSQELGGTR